jgi:hypothetical protein
MPCQAQELACRQVLGSSKAFQAEQWGFKNPEVESKLRIGSQYSAQELKKLVNGKIRILDGNNRPVYYRVEFNKNHIYKDTYFDQMARAGVQSAKSLGLFKAGSLLRFRERWDKGADDTDFKYAKGVFQSKSESKLSDQDDENGLFARAEIKGKEIKRRKKSQTYKEDLNFLNNDEAVKFAREQIGFKGNFQPVLDVEQDRFFMKLIPPHSHMPEFYLSVDDVLFKALVGRKAFTRDLVAELEFVEDLDEEKNPVNLEQKIQIFKNLTLALSTQFNLTPAMEDKYAFGVRSAVLDLF